MLWHSKRNSRRPQQLRGHKETWRTSRQVIEHCPAPLLTPATHVQCVRSRRRSGYSCSFSDFRATERRQLRSGWWWKRWQLWSSGRGHCIQRPDSARPDMPGSTTAEHIYVGQPRLVCHKNSIVLRPSRTLLAILILTGSRPFQRWTESPPPQRRVL